MFRTPTIVHETALYVADWKSSINSRPTTDTIATNFGGLDGYVDDSYVDSYGLRPVGGSLFLVLC